MPFSSDSLFGIPSKNIKPLCILMPFLTKNMAQGLNLTERHIGSPYASFQSDRFTVIQTRMGALFTGDATLALKDTPCQNILFIGACGSLNKEQYPIGSLVSPTICHAAESFSQMAHGQINLSHEIILQENTANQFAKNVMPVRCASVGSILLEDKFQEYFRDNKIDVLDMECASVFSAAKSISRPAAALLYVTDIVGETSPYKINNDTTQNTIDLAQKQIIAIINSLF